MSTGGTPLPISTSFAEPLNNPPKDQFIRRAEFEGMSLHLRDAQLR